MATWNVLDCVLGGIALISVLTAAVKGFVREVIALGSVLGGLAVAALEYRRMAPSLEGLAHSLAVAEGISFLLLFLAVLAAGAVLSAISKTLIQRAELTGFDRFLGGTFGLLRGVLIDSILLLALVAFSIEPAAVEKSRLAPYIVTGAQVMALAMPRELKNDFAAGLAKFRAGLIQNDRKGLERSSKVR